jgi:hypothetical protein
VKEEPKPTGKPVSEVTLNGAVFPWDGMQPVLLTMPGSDLLYLPCFQDVSDLEAIMDHYQIEYASVKRIDDEREFTTSITNPRVAVILNPRITETGRLRFMQVL